MLKQLDWDSNFFELQIAEYKTNKSNSVDLGVLYDLIYVISNDDKQISIKGYSQTFKENKVLFSKNNLIYKNINNESITSFANTNLSRSELYNLAFESGKYSRFKLDKKFKDEEFKKLYKVWIDNSLENNFATDVLVYIEKNKLGGFVTYKINDNYATIGLIAVSTDQQGKGIGRKLIQFVETKLIESNILSLRIPTQKENIEACSFYEKLGYKITESTIIKHYWKNDSI